MGSGVKTREATAAKTIRSLIQREKMAPWLLRAAEKTGGFAEWDQREITVCLWININSTHELKTAIMSMGDFHGLSARFWPISLENISSVSKKTQVNS